MAKELRIDIVGTATQFGAAAKEALTGLDALRMAASQTVQIESAAATRQVAADLGRIREAAAAAGGSSIKAAATSAKSDLNEVKQAASVVATSAAVGASRAAATAISTIGRASTGLISGLTGGLVGGGIAGIAVGGVLWAVEKIVGYVRETRQLIQEADRLDLTPRQLGGYRRAERVLGLDSDLIPQAIGAARQARSDALAGQPEAVENFKKLGLSLKEIADLSPDKLFFRIAEAFKDADSNNTGRRFAARGVLGSQAADALVPYFLGGPTRTTDVFGVELQTRPRLRFDRPQAFSTLLEEPDIRKRYRAALEPLSDFGLSNQQQARKAEEQNLQRALLIARSQLTTEERTTLAVQERARLLKLIASEGDPLKKQRLIGDALQVEAELAGLASNEKKQTAPTYAGGTRTFDPLRSVGADLSRFAPTLSTNLQERQIGEIRTLRTSLETRLRAVETAVRDAI